MLRDQIHSAANAAPHPYMQSNPQETATQASILASQANSLISKIIKHIGRSLCEIYERMLDDCIQRGIKIRRVPYYDNEKKQQYFKVFDFGELRGKKFIPKITSITPQLNTQVQMAMLEKILTVALSNQNPELVASIDLRGLIKEFLKKGDIDNPEILRTNEEAQQELMKINEKEQIHAAVKSGQFTLIPTPQPNNNRQQKPMGIPQQQG